MAIYMIVGGVILALLGTAAIVYIILLAQEFDGH